MYVYEVIMTSYNVSMSSDYAWLLQSSTLLCESLVIRLAISGYKVTGGRPPKPPSPHTPVPGSPNTPGLDRFNFFIISTFYSTNSKPGHWDDFHITIVWSSFLSYLGFARVDQSPTYHAIAIKCNFWLHNSLREWLRMATSIKNVLSLSAKWAEVSRCSRLRMSWEKRKRKSWSLDTARSATTSARLWFVAKQMKETQHCV